MHLTPSLLFPGLRGSERLNRHTVLPTRGTLLASDGTPLAEGPDRSSPIPSVAGQIVGTLESIPKDDAAHYTAMGYPADAQVGSNGLEHIFQTRLAGRVGGKLLAGKRVLASVKPVEGRPVHTTIDPGMETAAVAATASGYSGIAVMNPKTGGLEALAGIAFSALQPPGSTMKIVTTVAALQAHLATPATVYPDATESTVGGSTIQNAGGEDCGGTLINAFAVSCNSVFAPLGVKVGAKRFLATAERFGFNHPSPIPGALEPTVPPSSLNDDAELGPSAIGQGLVQATPLQMTDVAATIADGGRRPIPDAAGRRQAPVRARDDPPGRRRAAADDGGRRQLRNRYHGADPGCHGRGQDRHLADHQRHQLHHRRQPAEHRRLVCRLRPGRVAGRCRRRAVPQRRLGGDAAAPSVRDVLEYALSHQ